ncbi:MAG: Jag N-terminal domain-containing protein [Oscillospiraceae bacterium]|nr:Jag N-terminal domain-containing protein [Oscillospiraceae bacterium]
MEKTLIATGKTIDLAIESALAQLGLDRDSVSVQVLTQAKSGFLGLGATPAKVEVTYEAPDPVPEAPKVALSSASRSKPKAAAPVKQPQTPKAEPAKTVQPKAEDTKTEKPQKAEKKPEAPKMPKTYAAAEPGSTEDKIEQFLKGLLEHMESQAVPHAWKVDENTYKVDLVGDDLGYLIGRRGDTLDAIQHLCNYSVKKFAEGHIRINVDAEEYREKREESLRRYARKKAQQVLKARRRCSLEPMNAYERHVIHATLQEMENITTHSTGTEPNRRVVIEYVK